MTAARRNNPMRLESLRIASQRALKERAPILAALANSSVTASPAQFDVELPIPPSLNGAYANVAGVGRVKVSTYRNWQVNAIKSIVAAVPAHKRVGGPISVSILLPAKMRGDCDNRIKPVMDALVKSGRVDDDRNVVKVSASKELQGKALALVSVRGVA